MNLTWEKYKFLIAIIVLAVLVLVVLLISNYQKGGLFPSLGPQSSPVPLGTPEPEGLGSQIYEENLNPVSKVPKTNPFQETETNPFEEAKTNPFKDSYKNPFE